MTSSRKVFNWLLLLTVLSAVVLLVILQSRRHENQTVDDPDVNLVEELLSDVVGFGFYDFDRSAESTSMDKVRLIQNAIRSAEVVRRERPRIGGLALSGDIRLCLIYGDGEFAELRVLPTGDDSFLVYSDLPGEDVILRGDAISELVSMLMAEATD